MKKVLLTMLAAIPGYLYAQTFIYQQDFNSNVSNKVADYKQTTAGGSPIVDDIYHRFDSYGAIPVPTGIAYAIDADGLKITRTSGSSQTTAQIRNLAPINGESADVAFVQFDFKAQTDRVLTPGGFSPILLSIGEGYTPNSNTDEHDQKSYMIIGVYYPTANSDEFGIKYGTTALGGTYTGSQKITWVVNRSAAATNYTGPGNTPATVASASFDLWVGTTKIDLSGVTITPKVATQGLKDFKIRQGTTWVGYTAFKNVRMGYLKADGSSSVVTSTFSQDFDSGVSTTLLDYLVSSNIGNVPAGTVGGPIAEANRLSSIPNRSQQTTPGFYYSVDADGFKINRGANADIKQTAHISNLALPNDGVAFASFTFTPNQGQAYTTYTPLVFYFGQDYNNSSTDEGTKHFQSLGIKFHSATEFRFGDDATNLFSGSKAITWVVNRNAESVSYVGPDNNTYILTANGGYHVFVDNIIVKIAGVPMGDNASPSNATPQLKDFRIRAAANWGAAPGSVAIKNIQIGYPNYTVLPVKISKFTAKANASSVVLNWNTESESNASHFNVTRSSDGANFGKIGQLSANNVASKYFYTDFSPVSGTNYYQLEQVDNNGNTEKSGIVSATILANDLALSIAATSTKGINVQVNSPEAQNANIVLSNQLGQVIATKSVNLQKGINNFDLDTNYKGLVIVSVQTAKQSISKKTIK